MFLEALAVIAVSAISAFIAIRVGYELGLKAAERGCVKHDPD